MNTAASSFDRTDRMPAWILGACALVMIATLVWMATEPRIPRSTVWIVAATTAIAIGVLSMFLRLRVQVVGGVLRATWCYGWPQRTLPLAEIAEARLQRAPWFYGYGLRLAPYGVLWRVRGDQAVVLTRTDGKRFSIGVTDAPALLRALIAEGVRSTDAARS